MMIKHIKGDLFSVKEGYIIHGCNAQGVMGAGVALIVKMVYPEAFDAYRACLNKKRELGKDPLGSTTICPIDDTNLVIVNAVTQEYYGAGKRHTDYDAVRACLVEFTERTEKYHKLFKDVPRVLNFPLIGCGLGGGEWEVIEQIIEEEIDDSFEKVLWTL